jgi:hypothetical protein
MLVYNALVIHKAYMIAPASFKTSFTLPFTTAKDERGMIWGRVRINDLD